MPPPFTHVTLPEVAVLLRRPEFKRRIADVHLHHTWRPTHRDYRGHDTIEAMWRHHTQTNGWRDIAQHLTIAPDGALWLGRSWNAPPASAGGHNGNDRVGPFMIEMVGDFDEGRDPFQDPQRETALRVVALVQKRFGLAPETLRFHRAMADKSCPGTAIVYDDVLADVRRLHEQTEDALAGVPLGRGPESAPFKQASYEAYARIDELAREVSRQLAGPEEPALAEPAEAWEPQSPAERGAAEADRAPELSPHDLAALRGHVVNLRQGAFSEDGRFQTTPEDIDALFDAGGTLDAEVRAAQGRGEALDLLFYAHGGLVSEANALRYAHATAGWWRAGGVYPLYFVWETGLFETLRQILIESRRRASRDLYDVTTDPVVAAAARTFGGERMWAGMKRSAERASQPDLRPDARPGYRDGGARYVARKLHAFCVRHGEAVRLHAVGHSAGSIFHAHFLPAALDEKCPPFQTLHLLAPAIRVDAFLHRLGPRVGRDKQGKPRGVDRLTVFTMKKDLERADHCMGVYRKSLLYLVHHALEAERDAPILGLEASLRAEPRLRPLLGLDGAPEPPGEVVWSRTEKAGGRSASRATTHGGFDDDPVTMQAVLRRVRGLDDRTAVTPFPPRAAGRGASEWEGQVDWPEGFEEWFGTPDRPPPPPAAPAYAPAVPAYAPPAPVYVPSGPHSAGGSRRALCVGIDAYPTAPLGGCVADARLWRQTLTGLGFDVPPPLVDGQASRQAIVDGLGALVASGRPGDVLVFQFAGHGTQLPDLDGDEADGDTPGLDEALCAYDFADGAFVIDDDVAEVFEALPDGVNLTCFIDCCHSGTITRFGVGAPPADGPGRPRARYVHATAALVEAHRRFREGPASRSRGRSTRSASRGPDAMKEVLFSACLSSELAWESNGQGEFTARATRLLQGDPGGLTHEAFAARVTEAFGPAPRQHPQLTCAPAARGRTLLQPLTAAPAVANGRAAALPPTDAAHLLRTLADALAGVR